ncbi:MAG: hypothetical protein K0B08_03670 [Bacteroidales bacterium]|nr:hypothetical protein [Bacteroidales bacterium]
MRNIIFFGLFTMVFILSSCSVLQQTSEIKNFARCDFRLESISNLRMAGVNIQNKNSMSDLGFMEIAKITAAVASNSLPVHFDLDVLARNPNSAMAAMNKLDWILLIDDIEMTRGVLIERIEIQPNSYTAFPVAMNFDLMKALSGKSGDALLNFIFNLTGSGGKPARVKLKAKPTIMVGSTALEYPGYITIKQDF